MKIFRWFKRKPQTVTVHMNIDALEATDVAKLAEKIRAELIRARRRGGGASGIS